MFILYIIVGSFAFAAIVGVIYALGWALKNLLPNLHLIDENDPPMIVGLMGIAAVLIVVLVLMLTYGLGCGVFSLFTGGK